MPSKPNHVRKFRIMHRKYEDVWQYGIAFYIDWKNCNGYRDKYIAIHLGRHDIMIGLLTKYEEDY